MPERLSRPSLADVAARAGVSGQTVSRVVNGIDNVGDVTKARVEAALAELGYRPHRAARVLRTGRSHVIGVVVTTLASVGNSLMLQALTTAAAERSLSIALVTLTTPTSQTFTEAVGLLAEQAVDGVIVMNEASRFAPAAVGAPLPIVLIDADDADGFATVRSDHRAGAAAATRLVRRGDNPVHHVAGPASSYAAHEREGGWREAAGEHAPAVLRGDWTAASGYVVGRTLAADPGVSAVFCANDQMALGVMRAMHEAGRSIPGDVAVVGFDGIADAAEFWPPLSTVAQDFPALARAAITAVLADGVTHTVAPVRVVERASTHAG